MKLISFGFFVIIFGKFYIYLLKVCFSDIFLPSQTFEIECLFIALTSILTIPLWFFYESTYQLLKKKLFDESFGFLLIYSIEIILGFCLSDLLVWSKCSFKFKSILMQFILVNVIHFIFCIIAIFYFSKENTNHFIKPVTKIIEYKFEKTGLKNQTLNFQTANKLHLFDTLNLLKKSWVFNENNFFILYKNIFKKINNIETLYFLIKINLLKKKLKRYFFINYSKLKRIDLKPLKTKNFPISKNRKQNLKNKLVRLKHVLNKSSYTINEEIELNIIKKGRKYQQGIGYLEDGSLVFIENGKYYIGFRVRVKIERIYQTAKGKLFFTKLLTIYNS